MSLTAYQELTGAVQSVTPSKPLPVTNTGSGTTSTQVQGPAASGVATVGNPVKVGAVYNSTLPTYSTGQQTELQSGIRGALRVQLISANGTTEASCSTPNNDALVTQTGLSTTSYATLYNGSTWEPIRSVLGTSTGTGVGVTAVHTTPNTSANSGIALNATSAAASSLVLKASAGNLYGINVVAGASAGYLMIFNATSAPADGAVTPIFCMAVAANASLAFSWDIPVVCSTGITAVFSTTGPFTKTASATAFISGMAK